MVLAQAAAALTPGTDQATSAQASDQLGSLGGPCLRG